MSEGKEEKKEEKKFTTKGVYSCLSAVEAGLKMIEEEGDKGWDYWDYLLEEWLKKEA